MKRKTLTLLASAAVALTLCLLGTGSVFASTTTVKAAADDLDVQAAMQTAEDVTAAAGTITAVDLNGVQNINDYIFSTSSEEPIAVVLPEAGTLTVMYASASGSCYAYLYDAAGNSITRSWTDTADNGVKTAYFIVDAPQTLSLKLSGASDTNQAAFAALYVPSKAKQLAKNKLYIFGTKANNTGKFTFKAPSTGYLTVGAKDYSDAGFSIKMKTKGFSNYQTLYNKDDSVLYVGCKKGTKYSFNLETYAPAYAAKVLFNQVKESKYGTSKKKAASIKKKSNVKGLLITGGQKTHWYKFKNPKTQKVNFTVRTRLSDTGSKLGGMKITVYSGKQSSTRTFYSAGKTYTWTIYNTSGQKLKKGTYYLKVAPYNKATGEFLLKWK